MAVEVDDDRPVQQPVQHGRGYLDLDLETPRLNWRFMFWTCVYDVGRSSSSIASGYAGRVRTVRTAFRCLV
jgi:hypothetical protein